MTAAYFLAMAALLAAGVLVTARRFLTRTGFAFVLIGLPAWLLYVGYLSASGVIRDPALRPPGIVYVFAPVLLFLILFAARSAAGLTVARRLPLALLTAAQAFRIPVELGLHRLAEEGLVPMLMTYERGNVDIVIGLSAVLVAWLWSTRRIGTQVLMAWNVLGVLALVNIAARGVLSAPGPVQLIHAEVPNVAIGLFPYTYLAGFFAPLAVLMHILSLRAIRALRRENPEGLNAAY